MSGVGGLSGTAGSARVYGTSVAAGSAGVSGIGGAGGTADGDRLARAALSRIAEPKMPGVADAVLRWGAEALWDAVLGLGPAGGIDAELLDKLRKPGKTLLEVSPEGDLQAAVAIGARFVCPGDDEWPASLAVLGIEEPLGLWVRGARGLADVFDRSVAVVGARAATAYGGRVASDFGYELAGRGWTVVSGGAFGIDALAHRGALAAGGVTVAVLACGVDIAYPRSHDRLFARILEEGLILSEWPPGCSPRPHRFLVRNRVIAAATSGTVIVEGAVRSGALSTGRAAQRLGRPLMVVPGPITSAMSAGCHVLLREEGTRLVTSVAEVIEEVGRLGDDLSPRPEGETRSRDHLSAVLRGVLEAVPSRRPAGPALLASRAGVDLVVLRQSVGELIDAGFVELTEDGYRLSEAERQAIRDRREALLRAQPDGTEAAVASLVDEPEDGGGAEPVEDVADPVEDLES